MNVEELLTTQPENTPKVLGLTSKDSLHDEKIQQILGIFIDTQREVAPWDDHFDDYTFLNNIDYYQIDYVEQDNKIVSVVLTDIRRFLKPDGNSTLCLYIERSATVPEFRSQGHRAKIIKSIIEQMNENPRLAPMMATHAWRVDLITHSPDAVSDKYPSEFQEIAKVADRLIQGELKPESVDNNTLKILTSILNAYESTKGLGFSLVYEPNPKDSLRPINFAYFRGEASSQAARLAEAGINIDSNGLERILSLQKILGVN